MRTVLTVTLVLLGASCGRLAADETIFSHELNLIGGYSDQEDWVSEKGKGLKNAVGFEYFRKFVGEQGDFMTADLQVRVSYDSQEDANDAWGIELHNAWLEYKLSLGKNLRAGHFDPAFGLEPLLDTHGTLFQTLAPVDIGFKKDWGVGYRGALGAFDVEAAVQAGSGMGLAHKDGSFLVSARVGTPPGDDLQWGLSALHGEVLTTAQTHTIPTPNYADEATEKTRVGADIQYTLRSYALKGEVLAGRNEANDVMGAMVQVDYTVPRLQEVVATLQGQIWTDDPGVSAQTTATVGAGLSYEATRSLTLRVGVFHDLEHAMGLEETSVYFQVYYFGE